MTHLQPRACVSIERSKSISCPTMVARNRSVTEKGSSHRSSPTRSNGRGDPLVLADTAAYDARMRWQGISSRLAVAALVSTAIGTSTFVATASAQSSYPVTCVATSATQCVVTIDLVSNMDVDVVVTLPANNGFSLNTFTGTPDSAPSYTSLNNGYWTGTGTLWTCCLLQTGSSEPAGADSILTFALTPLTSSTTTVPKKHSVTLNLSFAARSSALNASDKSQLQALARNLTSGAKVTITGYALANPTLAQKRAIAAANYLHSRVKVSWSWRVDSISTRSLNRVTVTAT